MRHVQHELDGLDHLRRLWRQGIQHGVLLVPLHPVPTNGERLEVVLFTGDGAAKLSGRVTQATPTVTILQLDELTDSIRKQLASMGLTEVFPDPPKPEPAPEPEPSVEPPEPALAAEPAPASASVTFEPASPEAWEPDEEEIPTIPATAARLRPKPALKAAAFRPQAMRPTPSSSRMPAIQVSTGGMESLAGPGMPTPSASDRQIFASPGPAHARTEKLLPPATEHGDLARFSWRDALLHFFRKKATGVLAIDGFRETRWAYFVDGAPVHFLGSTPHPGEFLADALLQMGAVTQKQWSEASRLQKLTGVQAGEILRIKGELTQRQLDEALTRRTDRIARNLLTANFGRFRFHPCEDIRVVFRNQPVKVLDLLWGAQMDLLNAADEDALIVKAENLYSLRVRLVAGRDDIVPMLPMNSYEAHVAKELLPAAWTLKELVALNELEERALLKLLFALDAMGVIEFVPPEEESSKARRAQRILYEGWKDLTRRDAFSALHAHWSSNLDEIDTGYAKLQNEFSEARFGNALDGRVRELLERIHRLGAETYAKLKTKEGRREARKGIVGNDQLMMASDLLDKQGEMAMYKKDFPVAKALYEKVLELDPGGPEGRENRENARRHLAIPEVKHASTKGLILTDYTRQVQDLDER